MSESKQVVEIPGVYIRESEPRPLVPVHALHRYQYVHKWVLKSFRDENGFSRLEVWCKVCRRPKESSTIITGAIHFRTCVEPKAPIFVSSAAQFEEVFGQPKEV